MCEDGKILHLADGTSIDLDTEPNNPGSGEANVSVQRNIVAETLVFINPNTAGARLPNFERIIED